MLQHKIDNMYRNLARVANIVEKVRIAAHFRPQKPHFT